METPRGERPGIVGEAATSSTPTVSIVIPAYNEAHRIGPSIDRIVAFLDGNHPSSELVVVDDGSDDRTAAIARSKGGPGIRVVENGRNRGKGYSVRRGVLEARGEWVLFTDADLSSPIAEMDRLMEAIDNGADIAIGSRALDRSRIVIRQSPAREWGGILYNWAVQILLGLRIKDTQCGFKLFNREKIVPVIRSQTIDGFGFDAEMLFLAKRCGLKIREVPIEWSHQEGTKVQFLSDGIGMFAELLAIRLRWMTGKYR